MPESDRALPKRHPVARLLACAALASTAAAWPAQAALLDEPPTLYTFKLDDPASPTLPLLERFQNASIEHPGPVRVYTSGPWGTWRKSPWQSLSWLPPADVATSEMAGPAPYDGATAEPDDAPGRSHALRARAWTASAAESALSLAIATTWPLRIDAGVRSPAFASTGPSFASNGFDALWAPPPKPVPWWKCRRRPVTFARYGGETDSFKVLHCDGSVAPEALDRLSLMARPNGLDRPSDLLPDEPDAEAWKSGEWLPGIHLAHPRLLWVLQSIADAFPWRTVYVYSGYRPVHASEAVPKAGSHSSRHASARAMDIQVLGVPNAELFKVCRKLLDVGCGFYPNSKFVHIDVRPGSGHPFWIDSSGPGEPSTYVDSWPGVIERGGLAWDAKALAAEDAKDAGAPRPAPTGPCNTTGGSE